MLTYAEKLLQHVVSCLQTLKLSRITPVIEENQYTRSVPLLEESSFAVQFSCQILSPRKKK